MRALTSGQSSYLRCIEPVHELTWRHDAYVVPAASGEVAEIPRHQELGASLMDQVTDTREPVLIRRRGRESVALVAADELASWVETAYLLRSPRNARRLLEPSEWGPRQDGETIVNEELKARLGLNER